jgi:hypothetical protein
MLALEVKSIVSSIRRMELVEGKAGDPPKTYGDKSYECCDEGKKQCSVSLR